VASVNGGNEVVPTLRFEDGTTLTNPSIGQVQDKLA
jgi:mycoredoxin